MVQANELGIHAVGIDVSSFNAFISNCKLGRYEIPQVQQIANDITKSLMLFQKSRQNVPFEKHLLEELNLFNSRYFPSPDYKLKVRNNTIDETAYSNEKLDTFFPTYEQLIQHYDISLAMPDKEAIFLDKWFLPPVKEELKYVFSLIQAIECQQIKRILALMLSRTMRSCRATTHADLGTLKDAVKSVYYCKKHGKVCKPLFTMAGWWQRYTKDTIKRIQQFQQIRTSTEQCCLVGDSRSLDIDKELNKKSQRLSTLAADAKIRGIFSSPPYVGLIDYHEQHAYAYDLFGFDRNDASEIGPLCKGQGIEAKKNYVKGISQVLLNCKKHMIEDYNVFLVANDKHNLYPSIAKMAGMKIVGEYKRPVLNRVEKDRAAYSEIIFHMKTQ